MSGWNVRELRRQMKAMLFHQVTLSKGKAAILRVLNDGTPFNILRTYSETVMCLNSRESIQGQNTAKRICTMPL